VEGDVEPELPVFAEARGVGEVAAGELADGEEGRAADDDGAHGRAVGGEHAGEGVVAGLGASGPAEIDGARVDEAVAAGGGVECAGEIGGGRVVVGDGQGIEE